MKRVVQVASVVGALFALLLLISPTSSVVHADDGDTQSISDIEPSATPTPDIIQEVTDTPEATPEDLPTTGTSPVLLVGLLAVLLVCVGVYVSASPNQK